GQRGHYSFGLTNIAAFVQWQRFAAILNLSGVKLAPVMLPVNTEQCAGVFSFQRQGHRGSSPRNIAPHRVAPAYR
ncbi:hypothetical protein L3450_004487, partial [Salmonella enterica subsp. enterica serovar Agama]|nr:hypothetical protein [Salmonella enterica subsp. enterica serovar Agama]EIU1168107.1 hypothetical protein [Salmonella enterica subsp. enterica serovar Agama]EIU1206904.1 hypothetical protein [Salmonella enterica subsp. enterica serovar Agama]EIU1253807.1 hypothetical protein [Salmonella enterica subsp. enterica serovar Agama]EIU1280766.1 hypothetical protein [Salmonella enterica subsp. enterica serovar Agama]